MNTMEGKKKKIPKVVNDFILSFETKEEMEDFKKKVMKHYDSLPQLLEEEEEEVKKIRVNMKNRAITVLEGPIIFTSPHGITVMRDKPKGWVSHPREKWVTSAALRMSRAVKRALGGDSFIIWNEDVAKPKDKNNLDPNYLAKHQYGKCPFHKGLERLKEKFSLYQLPLMNFDLHGRASQKKPPRIALEVGCAPFVSKWKKYGNQPNEVAKRVKKIVCDEIEKVFKKWNEIRSNKKLEEWKIPFTVSRNPYFSGWWGGGLYTLSHQASQMGIPGFQLECPPVMRRLFASETKFCEDFGIGLVLAYEKAFGVDRKRVREILSDQRKGKEVVFGYKKYLAGTSDAIDEKRRK